MNDDMKKLLHVLTAIAEGYDVKGYNDRYIVVENPDFNEARGDDPNLVIDIKEARKWQVVTNT